MHRIKKNFCSIYNANENYSDEKIYNKKLLGVVFVMVGGCMNIRKI